MRLTVPSRPDQDEFLMLARYRDAVVCIVQECERQMLARLCPLDVLVDRAVQHLKKDAGIIKTAFMQRPGNRLHHQHQNATFNAVAGDVADPNSCTALGVEDVVIVAADLIGRFHVAGNLEVRNAVEFGKASACTIVWMRRATSSSAPMRMFSSLSLS